jgi:hypothetical protein
MSAKASEIIKICGKSTSFLVFNDKEVVFWGNVLGGGKGVVINDVARCLGIALDDAEQRIKARGVCLPEAVNIKEDKLLAEIIRDSVEQVFKNMKSTLKNVEMLEKVSYFFIIRDDNYIPDMDKLLSNVMEKPAKCVDLSMANISIKTPEEFSKVVG